MERGSRRRACLGVRGSPSRMQHGHLGGSLRNSNGTVLSAQLRMYDSSLCTRRPTLLSCSCPPVWAVSPPVPGTDMIHGDPPYGPYGVCVRLCDCVKPCVQPACGPPDSPASKQKAADPVTCSVSCRPCREHAVSPYKDINALGGLLQASSGLDGASLPYPHMSGAVVLRRAPSDSTLARLLARLWFWRLHQPSISETRYGSRR